MSAAVAGTASAAASAAAGTGIDLTKYTVYFTGVFPEDDSRGEYVFKGNLATPPGEARTIELAEFGIEKFKEKIDWLVS